MCSLIVLVTSLANLFVAISLNNKRAMWTFPTQIFFRTLLKLGATQPVLGTLTFLGGNRR